MPSRHPLALAVIMLLSTACSTVERAPEARPSGFLGDYSQMQPGGEGRALLVYVDPQADFAAYDKLIIDPITVWKAADSEMNNAPQDELAGLVKVLDDALREKLSADYELVDEPGPGTLRLRAALTEASESIVAMDIISSILPVGWVAGGISKLTTGTWSFVGSAGAEVEIIDSETGKRLLAGVDRQVGGKSAEGMTNSWDDVEKAFAHWSTRVAARLREERGPLDG